MKKFIYILFLTVLASCGKEQLSQPAAETKMFTATVNVTPSSLTEYYDLFVSNDPGNRNDSFMIWAARVTREQIKSTPFSFGFDFTGYVCMGFSVTPAKKLYGAIREYYGAYKYSKLNYNNVIIKTQQ